MATQYTLRTRSEKYLFVNNLKTSTAADQNITMTNRCNNITLHVVSHFHNLHSFKIEQKHNGHSAVTLLKHLTF